MFIIDLNFKCLNKEKFSFIELSDFNNACCTLYYT